MRFLLLLNVVICYCAVVAVDLEVHGLVSDDIEYDDNEEQISSGSGDVENEIGTSSTIFFWIILP